MDSATQLTATCAFTLKYQRNEGYVSVQHVKTF